MSYNHPQPPSMSWAAPLSIDLFLKVLNVTFLHPFVAWMIPLCMRAQAMKWDHTAMHVSIGYASLLTALYFLGVLNKQIAYAKPREVNLEDEVIVITGGASGLGLLIAEVYGMRGASVAVLDVKELESGEARGVTTYKCDVGNKEEVARVALKIQEELGTPTILINNAAVVHGLPLLSLPIASIESTISTNLLSNFYTIKTFLPAMIAQGGGTIVTVSSVLGSLGAASLTDYCSSKAAVSMLHRCLAAELRTTHPEIKTILVSPGQMTTPLFAGVKMRNFFWKFLCPVVEPVEVAKALIKQIDGGGSENLSMPLYARWAPWYEILPVGVQMLLRKASGADTAMEKVAATKAEKTEKTEKSGL